MENLKFYGTNAAIILGDRNYVLSPDALREIKKMCAAIPPDADNAYAEMINSAGRRSAGKRGKKTLFFRSLMNGGNSPSGIISQNSWYLASALSAASLQYVFCGAKLNAAGDDFFGKEELRKILSSGEIGFAVLPLTEFYLKGAAKLCRFIKKHCPDCIIAAGGIMPTRHPFHVLAHFPEIGLLIRGDGDEALPSALKCVLSGNYAGIAALRGVFFRDSGVFIAADPGHICRIKDLSSLFLDFSMLEKCDIEKGGYFYLSRGCRNACNFCVSYSRSMPRNVPAEKAARWFDMYRSRADELYCGKPPESALDIGFFDDDFFACRETGLEILRAARHAGLKISFVQTAVKSFFKDNIPQKGLDHDFIRSLEPDFFSESCLTDDMHPNLFIGTENFCDEELKTLGKGYGIKEISMLAEALSARGITQRHHLILSNIFTREKHIKENIAAVYALRHKFPRHFYLLQSITPALYSFYGTCSYAAAKNAGMLDYANMQTLKISGYPEFDYPVAGGDVPADSAAAAIVPAALEALKRL